MIPPRRKKWTEAEEKTLIDKYGEMVGDGTLAKMRTREKKFKPIACHVNTIHHLRDPVAFPWQWSWEDGDFGAAMDNEVMGLGFEYDVEEGEENCNGSGGSRARDDVENGYVCENGELTGLNLKKKRKVVKGMEKKAWRFLANQLRQLREMEARFEQREMDRERERQRRENVRVELDKQWEKRLEEREKDRMKARRQWMPKWEAMEKENEEMERKRRDEELIREREREERMNCRRLEWKKRVDEMLNQHRAEMGQMQTRILHEQQNLTSQLLGIFSQWTAQPAGLSDHTSASNHYLSQMMQNLHHVNGMVHGDTRVEGDNQEDQFIVDG